MVVGDVEFQMDPRDVLIHGLFGELVALVDVSVEDHRPGVERALVVLDTINI